MHKDPSQIIDSLEAVYSRAIHSKTDQVFFQNIYDYIEAFDVEPDLIQVNKAIVKLSDLDLKNEFKLEKQTKDEIIKVHKEVEQYLIDSNIDNRVVHERLASVTRACDDDLVSSVGITEQMFGDLTYGLMILAKIDDLKHLNFCRNYGKIHDNASVANWENVSKTYPLWKTEKGKNTRLRKMKVWHAWNEIVEFHNWYKDYEVERDKLIDQNKLWELGYVSAKFKVIDSLIRGEKAEKNSGIDIERDEYQRYLDMIHQYIKKQLNSTSRNDDASHPDCVYDSKNGTLTINGKSIVFTPKQMRGLVLSMFLQSKWSRKRELYWEDILEKTQDVDTGAQTPEQRRHKVFYAVEGINERISREFQIQSFLIYINGKVSLNSEFYL